MSSFEELEDLYRTRIRDYIRYVCTTICNTCSSTHHPISSSELMNYTLYMALSQNWTFCGKRVQQIKTPLDMGVVFFSLLALAKLMRRPFFLHA